MAKTAQSPIDGYLRAQPPHVRAALERVRSAIARAIPRAEEGISYQIPAYKLGTSPVVFFAGWKAHYSLYPASAALVAAFARELEPYSISKGTIRFPLDQKVPTTLIARLAKFLFAEASARAAAKALRETANKAARKVEKTTRSPKPAARAVPKKPRAAAPAPRKPKAKGSSR